TRLRLSLDRDVVALGEEEALQMAVEKKEEIAEPLPPRKRHGSERFWLVHFSVAHESPHRARCGIGDAAAMQIFEEARLIDRHQRAEPHGYGGELPEFRHQPGMRIGREAAASRLVTELQKLWLGEPALDEGPRVDARPGVALDIDEVAAVLIRRRAPEVTKADVIERGRRLEAGDMAAEFGGPLVGAQNDRNPLPTKCEGDSVLDIAVPVRTLLALGRNGVDIWGIECERRARTRELRLLAQSVKQKRRPLSALVMHDGAQRIDPFARFHWIGIRHRQHELLPDFVRLFTVWSQPPRSS